MTQRQNNSSGVAIGSAVTMVLALIIAVITLAPMPSGGPGGSDKLYHVVAFASLAFPLPLVRPRLAIWVVVGVTAYGGLIEVIQPFFGRQAEWADLVADAIGAILGSAIGRQLGVWFRRSGVNTASDDPLREAWLAEDATLDRRLRNDVAQTYDVVEGSPTSVAATPIKSERRQSK